MHPLSQCSQEITKETTRSKKRNMKPKEKQTQYQRGEVCEEKAQSPSYPFYHSFVHITFLSFLSDGSTSNTAGNNTTLHFILPIQHSFPTHSGVRTRSIPLMVEQDNSTIYLHLPILKRRHPVRVPRPIVVLIEKRKEEKPFTIPIKTISRVA